MNHEAFAIINIHVRSPLQDALRAQMATDGPPVRESDYRGAMTAAEFTDAHEEFTALLNGCGVYDLGFRVRISLKGGDACAG